MQDWLVPYASTIQAMGVTAGLMLAQLLVLDVAGIKAGHRPGAPVVGDHANFFFRAHRAHANTNESVAIFMLLAVCGVLSGASPWWLNTLAWVYVLGRLAHMLCYYANVPLLRSASFLGAFVALIGMLIASGVAWQTKA